MTWTFREQIMVSLITAQGHAVVKERDYDHWVICTRCNSEWWLTKRLQMADDPTHNQSDPLHFKPCPRKERPDV